MKHYLLDTNVFLLGIRAGNDWAAKRRSFGLDKSANFISVVTLGPYLLNKNHKPFMILCL